jgi:glucosamine-6-phosphate deaminase
MRMVSFTQQRDTKGMGYVRMEIQRFQVEKLKIEVYPDRVAAGRAAAETAAQSLRALAAANSEFAAVFATGASQLEMLHALTVIPGLPWDKVVGFHLDEYVGLDENHPASFRRYLRENLISRVKMRAFYEVDGSSVDPEAVCREYAARLRAAAPKLCLLGIGENGHLAFNEPGEADFDDPADVKVVTLDATCRQQQTAEGWFGSIVEVPANAITVTIPALFRIPRLILSVPGERKAEIMKRVLTEPIAPRCPATILRSHPDATVYLDSDSAAGLENIVDRMVVR